VIPSRQRFGVGRFLRLGVVTALVGVGGGISGILITLLLKGAQHLAYGATQGSFFAEVTGAPPDRRVIALAIAGVVGGVGWWALRRWARPVVPLAASVAGQRMPALTTWVNVVIQVTIVGLGASIGRELAPRELAALFANWLSDRAGVSARERRILVACGAGAGLAAVYNVPLGGAVFTLEILLAEVGTVSVIAAVATSAIATLVARIVVPDVALYTVPRLVLSPSLIVWAVIAGPVLGLAGAGFVRAIQALQRRRPTGWRILVVMPVVFTAIGVVALAFPAILGNGRSLAQIAFNGSTPVALLAVLLLLKAVVTLATIGSGAAGGTLTPSVAIGATFGAVTGGLWLLVWPGSPIAAFVFIGAAAFLASSMRAPLTALVLVWEFTQQGSGLFVPALLAVAGSVVVARLLERRRVAGVD
jgi:CIC family chloride channel protein